MSEEGKLIKDWHQKAQGEICYGFQGQFMLMMQTLLWKIN